MAPGAGDHEGMHWVQDLRYDPRTRVLTVRWATPSRTARTTYEYRDVDPALAAELLAARPHVGRLLATRVVPLHPARRLGETVWRPPAPQGHGEPLQLV